MKQTGELGKEAGSVFFLPVGMSSKHRPSEADDSTKVGWTWCHAA